MRNPGAVYKKLREVKYRHLVELYKKFLRRTPEYCRYNKAFQIQTDGLVREIRLCMLHQPEEGLAPHLLDICQETGHCAECNAFVSVHTKESIRQLFEEELKSINLKARKYPDICALEWVLEQYEVIIPPFSWVNKFFYLIKKHITLWP